MLPRASFKGRQLVLVKPSTFMNLSGKAVRYWLDAEKIQHRPCSWSHDDINLPFGTLRLRAKGSDGGTTDSKTFKRFGLQSLTPDLRFGVGADFGPGRQVDHVLGSFLLKEEKALQSGLKGPAPSCSPLLSSASAHHESLQQYLMRSARLDPLW